MGNSRTVLALIVFISSILSQNVLTSYGQDVLGAGGFIRSKKNIDFSRIQIELYSQTQGGVFRKVESTDAAPNNGYFFIPVEETGQYRLKPIAPRGWKIEPEEMDVNIDGKTDDQEFDFEFIGFGITGTVYTRSESVGPPGIDIELVSPETGGQSVLQTSKTDESGQYVFFGVLPGRYILRIGQDYKSKYDFDTQQHEVDVGEDVGASFSFQIMGYRIVGSITTSNGDNLPNVKFVLSSLSGESITTALSNSEGYFTFSNVDNGDYLVKLDSAEAGQSALQLVTSEMPITIDHDHQNVPNFVVKSFTLDGSVIASSITKRPLSDVKIKAAFGDSAHEVGLETVTNGMGKFSLTGIQSGRPLKIKAAIDGYDFEGISLSSVTPRYLFIYTLHQYPQHNVYHYLPF